MIIFAKRNQKSTETRTFNQSSTMKGLRLFIFATGFAALCVGCKSGPYALESVQPHRIEVTKALDANPSKAAETFIAKYRPGVDSLRMPFVGQSAISMAANRPESPLSNWVADVLAAAAQRMGYAPDLGVCNIGGLRAAMPEGTVRMGDILAITPFENFFTILRLKGSDVEALMHDIAAVHGEGVSSSARLKITPDGKLISATLGGRPIKADSIYTIATLDYLADGNDKLYALKRSIDRKVTKEPIRETLINHFKLLNEQGKKAEAKVEGRITVVGDDASDNSSLTASSKAATTDMTDEEQTIVVRDGKGGKAGKNLFIVHTNDTHSCIEPLNPLLADTANANKGGYLRRAVLIDELRRQHGNEMLLVDAGDFSQGSTYYSLYHGDVEIGLMNLMGYEAATIGNHEFDWGLENMARIFRMAKFPIICCNYDFSGTPVEGLVKPYTIINRNGLKIGLLGVAPQLEGLVSTQTCKGVRFIDPIAAVQPIADYLKNTEKCDLIVCISHLGWQVAGLSDEELITSTRNIDIVIGGHSHTYLSHPEVLNNLDGHPVIENTMGKNARYVGTLNLSFKR